MTVVTLCYGLPASGKSTWARVVRRMRKLGMNVLQVAEGAF